MRISLAGKIGTVLLSSTITFSSAGHAGMFGSGNCCCGDAMSGTGCACNVTGPGQQVSGSDGPCCAVAPPPDSEQGEALFPNSSFVHYPHVLGSFRALQVTDLSGCDLRLPQTHAPPPISYPRLNPPLLM